MIELSSTNFTAFCEQLRDFERCGFERGTIFTDGKRFRCYLKRNKVTL